MEYDKSLNYYLNGAKQHDLDQSSSDISAIMMHNYWIQEHGHTLSLTFDPWLSTAR